MRGAVRRAHTSPRLKDVPEIWFRSGSCNKGGEGAEELLATV